MRSLDYMSLLGRWLTVTRPLKNEIEELEAKARDHDPAKASIGGEGLCVSIVQLPDGVEIVLLDKLGHPTPFHIHPDDELKWAINAWTNREARFKLL